MQGGFREIISFPVAPLSPQARLLLLGLSRIPSAIRWRGRHVQERRSRERACERKKVERVCVQLGTELLGLDCGFVGWADVYVYI